VTAGPLGEGVADNVDVMVEWLHHPRCGEGVINDDREALGVSNGHDGVHIGDLEPRVRE